jgi:hypothetical protein
VFGGIAFIFVKAVAVGTFGYYHFGLRKWLPTPYDFLVLSAYITGVGYAVGLVALFYLQVHTSASEYVPYIGEEQLYPFPQRVPGTIVERSELQQGSFHIVGVVQGLIVKGAYAVLLAVGVVALLYVGGVGEHYFA